MMNKIFEKNYYAALGVQRDIEQAALKKAYRQAVLLAHPDKGGTDDAMSKVNEAWECLNDPEKRRRYDAVSLLFKTLLFCFTI